MTRYQITVDEECNAEQFWDALNADLQANGPSQMGAADLQALANGEHVTVDQDQRDQLVSYLRRLPGWDTGIAHAPHPVVINEQSS